MPISHKYKVIFIHIPKTSGTYIENLLGMHENINKVGLKAVKTKEANSHLFGNGVQHLTIYGLSDLVDKQIFNCYTKFTVVRNPYTRIISSIAWSCGHKSWQSNGKKMQATKFTEKLNKIYTQFKENGKLPQRHQLQYNYTQIDGENCMDKIFKFEEYTEIDDFLSDLGITVKKEKRMVTDKYADDVYLTKDNKEKIYEMYKKDFDFFGYSK